MIALVLVLAAGPARAGAQRPAPLVFDSVTVVDVEHGTLLQGQRVVITGSRITAMRAADKVKLPTGARVVDARGKYLIPGLWDMHVHAIRDLNFSYPLFLANGITGIRNMWSDVPLDTLRLWQREILAGTRVGPPRQLLSGVALFEGETPEPGIDKAPCATDATSRRGVRHWRTRASVTGPVCVDQGDTADMRRLVQRERGKRRDALLSGIARFDPVVQFS